ncbi:hypothetical protein HW132_16170 [Brasilonema sp. CT11]|nr:hypothetical protein [Brasilonema sp. CT11]
MINDSIILHLRSTQATGMIYRRLSDINEVINTPDDICPVNLVNSKLDIATISPLGWLVPRV